MVACGSAARARARRTIVETVVEAQVVGRQVHDLLGRAAAGSGKTAESHRALAEYHYLNGELEAAMKKAESADTGSYIEMVGQKHDYPSGLKLIGSRQYEMYGI